MTKPRGLHPRREKWVGIEKELEKSSSVLEARVRELGERVKELNCLYGFSKLVDQCGDSLKGIFQGIVNLIPPAWQYPGITCARLTVEGVVYQTANFKGTVWKQSAPVVTAGTVVGNLYVGYLEEMPESDEGPFLKEERALLNGLCEEIGRILERAKAREALKLSQAELEQQKTTLAKKNIVLQELLLQIEQEKKQIKDDVAANVENLLLPLVDKLRLHGASRKYVHLLKQNLNRLTSAFGRKISSKKNAMTPKEVEICDMIRSGLSSKEMSALLHISLGTVEIHRVNIRRKLGIANKSINLPSYLQTL